MRGADRWMDLQTWALELSPSTRGRRIPRRPPAVPVGAIPACEGSSTRSLKARKRPELSSRTRGRPIVAGQVALGDGAIPACAGPTSGPSSPTTGCRSYPRTRGADDTDIVADALKDELFPHARSRPPCGELGGLGARAIPAYAGRQPGPGVRPGDHRAIPACAGPTRRPSSSVVRARSYPCVRGGNLEVPKTLMVEGELFPHTRGRLGLAVATGAAVGAIPAYVGPTASAL